MQVATGGYRWLPVTTGVRPAGARWEREGLEGRYQSIDAHRALLGSSAAHMYMSHHTTVRQREEQMDAELGEHCGGWGGYRSRPGATLHAVHM